MWCASESPAEPTRYGYGWMLRIVPLRVSVMVMFPPCDAVYTSHGRARSGTAKKPSPPLIVTQSRLRIPCSSAVRTGPHQCPLSCSPPHTL